MSGATESSDSSPWPLLLGVIVFGLVWLLEPAAMRRQADPLGEQAGEAIDEPLPEPEPARLLS